jgi:hypothetical protein
LAGSSAKIRSGTGGNCTLKPFPVLKKRPRASASVAGAAGRCAGISAMLRGCRCSAIVRSRPNVDLATIDRPAAAVKFSE